MTHDIIWPERYLPGKTDNFVSNEVIVAGLSAAEVWPYLADMTQWETYYSNCGDIKPPSDSGSGSGSNQMLEKGQSFSFSTFGFPPLKCECTESVDPRSSSGGDSGSGGGDGVGRLAWRAEQDGFDCYHAWIVEDLDGGRVRILTQETQNGEPAKEMAQKRPNPMLNGHQEWLDGLVKTAKEKKGGK